MLSSRLIRMIEDQQFEHPIRALTPVTTPDELLALQAAVKTVYVAPAVKQYIVDITFATRDNEHIYLGASPRGALALYRASQARAAVSAPALATTPPRTMR